MFEWILHLQVRALHLYVGLGLLLVRPPGMLEREQTYDYSNGKPQAQGRLRVTDEFLLEHWQPHGPWLFFDQAGELMFGGTFDLGRRVGLWEGWYPGGKLGYAGHFESGRPSGEWKWWFPDGQLATVGSYSTRTDHGQPAGGVPTGTWSFWYQTGQLAARGDFAPTLEDGHVLQNGAPATLDGFLDLSAVPRMWGGQAQGPWTFLQMDGRPLQELTGNYACGWKVDETDPVVCERGETLRIVAENCLGPIEHRVITGFRLEGQSVVWTALHAVEEATSLTARVGDERVVLEILAKDDLRGVAALAIPRGDGVPALSLGSGPGTKAIVAEGDLRPTKDPVAREWWEESLRWETRPGFEERVASIPSPRLRLAPAVEANGLVGAPLVGEGGGVTGIVVDAIHCATSGGSVLLTVPLDEVVLSPVEPVRGLDAPYPSLVGPELPLHMLFPSWQQSFRLQLEWGEDGELVGKLFEGDQIAGDVHGWLGDDWVDLFFEPRGASFEAFEGRFTEGRLDRLPVVTSFESVKLPGENPIWQGLPPESLVYRSVVAVEREWIDTVEVHIVLPGRDVLFVSDLLDARPVGEVYAYSLWSRKVAEALAMEGQTLTLPPEHYGATWRLRGLVGMTDYLTYERWDLYPNEDVGAWILVDGKPVPEFVWRFTRDELDPRTFDYVLPQGTRTLQLKTSADGFAPHLVNGTLEIVR